MVKSVEIEEIAHKKVLASFVTNTARINPEKAIIFYSCHIVSDVSLDNNNNSNLALYNCHVEEWCPVCRKSAGVPTGDCPLVPYLYNELYT